MSDKCVLDITVGNDTQGKIQFQVYEKTPGVYITPRVLTGAGDWNARTGIAPGQAITCLVACAHVPLDELLEVMRRCQEVHNQYHKI